MENQITNLIKNAIIEAQTGRSQRKQIYSDPKATGDHEFLFFIKPEISIQSDSIKLDLILELIIGKINEFNLQIKNIVILPAAYLEKHSIIAQHYGVINAIARNASENLSSEAKNKFKEQYGADINNVKIFGGLELIKAYPAFTPLSIDFMWQNSPTVKLGGGAYCQSLKFDGQPVFLVNGFHPRQLEHFIAPGRSIVAFTLVGSTSWKTARNNFIGKTNPQDAENGSIRRILLENMNIFGLKAVNSSWNGVHLSAGPVEGLVELIRYNTDFNSEIKLTTSDFSFGKKLGENFRPDTIQKIFVNSTIQYEGKETNIFDCTEEKDVAEAIDILKKIYAGM
jgi:hypothetical protein